jgi:hypothetical protein
LNARDFSTQKATGTTNYSRRPQAVANSRLLPPSAVVPRHPFPAMDRNGGGFAHNGLNEPPRHLSIMDRGRHCSCCHFSLTHEKEMGKEMLLV